jgi:hypothetical protein
MEEDTSGPKGRVYCCGNKNPVEPHCVSTGTDDETALRHLQPIPKMPKGKPMICCMGYTHSKKHHHAKSMANSWMHRCDKYFFASDKADPSFNAIKMDMSDVGGESYRNMYNKVRKMWAYAETNNKECDWHYIRYRDNRAVSEV